MHQFSTVNPDYFILKSIPAIPYTPLSPVRTPTPTHVLYNSSSTQSPLDSPFSTDMSLHSPEEALISKLKTDVTHSPTSHPLLTSFQPSSPSPCTADSASAPASKDKSFPTPLSPEITVSQTARTAVTGIAPLLPVNVDRSPLVFPSSPPALALSSPSSHLPYPTGSQHSPYQTPMFMQFRPYLNLSLPMTCLIMNMVLNYFLLLLLFREPIPHSYLLD